MLLTEVGTFTSTAGPQDVALSNFGGATPKAVIIWHAGATADGVAAGAKFGFGAAVSASSRAAVTATSEDAQATSDADRRHANAKVLTVLNYAAAVIEEGDIALAADKFTITYSTSLTGLLYNFMALGGDALTNVYLDEITSPASTGSVAYTGVGFKPDCLIGFGAGHSTAPASTATHANLNVGVHDGTNSRAMFIHSDDAAATSDTKRLSNDSFLEVNALGAVTDTAAVTSLDADGYTLNWTAADGTTRYNWILALKGPEVKIAAYDQPATDITASRNIGFVPKAALCLTHMGTGTGYSDDVPTGATGQSFKFDGDNDYMENATLLDVVPAAVSISAFIKVKETGGRHVICGKENIIGQDRLYFYVHEGTGTVRFDSEQTNAGYHQVISTANVADGTWHHVGITWDAVNGKRVYVDGVLDNSDGAETTLMRDGTASAFGVADYWATGTKGNYYSNKKLKNLQVYSDALTTAEMVFLADATGASGTDPTTANLIASFPFDGDADDAVGSYDLTVVGAVNDDAHIGIGAWDSSNNMAFAGAVDEDAQATTDSDAVQDSNEAIKHIDHLQNIVGSCSVAAAGTSLVETWTNTDGTQREHVWLVLGQSTGGGGKNDGSVSHGIAHEIAYEIASEIARKS